MVYQILGASLTHLGRNEEAARIFGASEALRLRIGGGAPTQLVNTEQYRVRAESALGAERFAALIDEGGKLSDDEALAVAMAFEAAPGSPGLPPPEPWGVELERRQAVAAAAEAGTSNQ